MSLVSSPGEPITADAINALIETQRRMLEILQEMQVKALL